MSSTCNVTTVVVLDVFFKLIAISDNCLNSEISKITELTEVSFQELPEIGTVVLSIVYLERLISISNVATSEF